MPEKREKRKILKYIKVNKENMSMFLPKLNGIWKALQSNYNSFDTDDDDDEPDGESMMVLQGDVWHDPDMASKDDMAASHASQKHLVKDSQLPSSVPLRKLRKRSFTPNP